MIEINEDGKKVILRNIQEQVQKNKEDIAAFKSAESVLADFGITVLGVVETAVDIPEREYEYGDAWLVGAAAPYDVYIYTRTDVEGEGVFVDLGPIAIQGPQGPQGEPGIDGTDGSNGQDGTSVIGTYGESNPIISSTDSKGDIYINTLTQHLWMFNGTNWDDLIEIKGQEGEQGIQGPQGATGTTLSIVNKLSSSSLLPTDFSSGNIPKNSAYLIPGSNNENHLWIILGEQGDYSTWHWSDAGDFNLGSVIYKGGQFQYSLDVDTSIDADNPSQTNVPTDYAVALEVDRQIQDLYDTTIEPLESKVLVKPSAQPGSAKLVGLTASGQQELVNYIFIKKEENSTQTITNSGSSIEGLHITTSNANGSAIGFSKGYDDLGVIGLTSDKKPYCQPNGENPVELMTSANTNKIIADENLGYTPATTYTLLKQYTFSESGTYLIRVRSCYNSSKPTGITLYGGSYSKWAQREEPNGTIFGSSYSLDYTSIFTLSANDYINIYTKCVSSGGYNDAYVTIIKLK